MDESNESYQDYFQPDYAVDIEQFQQIRFTDSSHSLLQKIENSESDSKKELTTRLFKKQLGQEQQKTYLLPPAVLIEEEQDIRGEIQFSEEALRKNSKAIRGYPKETTQLNANLKTETANELLRGIKLHLYSQREKQAIWRFVSSGCSFEDTLELFRNSQKIRNHLLSLYSSPTFVTNIMRSSSMHFQNKLIFIKYLKTIVHNASNPQNYRKWKEGTYLQKTPAKDSSDQLEINKTA